MNNQNKVDIGQNYKDLIKYLSNIDSAYTINYAERNVFVQVRNSEREQYLQFRLNYHYDSIEGYDYNNLQIAWRLLGVSSFSAPHRFPKDMDQRIMFDIILFEITNWKLQNLNKIVTRKVNELLNSDTITDWLKTKEEQIRTEERAKIENHLSIEEFRKVVNEELGKVNINLKIGDK